MNKHYWLILLTAFILGCNLEDMSIEDQTDISEEERQLRDDCSAALLTTPEEIAANLIGNWELVGFACGYCAPGPSPNAFISFTDSTGMVSYQFSGFSENLAFTWEIKPYVTDTDTIYYLDTDPVRDYLYLYQFCEDYMYRDDVAVDGPLFLYKKR